MAVCGTGEHLQTHRSDTALSLEFGGALPGVTIAYETWGTLRPLGGGRTNAVLICHALTGDAHVARHGEGDKPGWWDLVVGPGKYLDTDELFVICSNTLGGCSGTTGPGDVNPATGRPWAASFPAITQRDAVAAAPAADVPLNPDEVVPDGCPPIEGTAEATQQFSEAPPMCLDDAIEYTALIETNVGSIEVDLDPELAPGTVNSFVFLARNRFFDDTVCHRIIQEFVVQCGDPTATGTGGPGYSTLDELPEAGQYEVGSFAMANSGPDTQGSQFFIITGDQGVALPPAYSLFGSVGDADLDVVAEMNARGSLDTSGTPSEEVRLVSVRIATA